MSSFLAPLPPHLMNMTTHEVLERAQKSLDDRDPLPFHAAGLVLEKEGKNDQAKVWYKRALHCYGYWPALEKLKKLFPQETDRFRELFKANWKEEHEDSSYAFLHIDSEKQLSRRITWLSHSAEMGSVTSKVDFDKLKNCPQAPKIDEVKMNRSYLLQFLEIQLARQSNPAAIARTYMDLGQKETALELYAKSASQGCTIALFGLEAATDLPPSINLKEVKAAYGKYWDVKAEATLQAPPNYEDTFLLVHVLNLLKNDKYAQRLYARAKEQGWTYIQDDLRQGGLLLSETVDN